ncbi:MAG: putative metal-binding motif-containing protein [Myxococcaceae bacterium]|nr:putative metal-binding motif-containing protein [Myxococcaceae bacterium]
MRLRVFVFAAFPFLACFAPVEDRLDGGLAGGAAGGQAGGLTAGGAGGAGGGGGAAGGGTAGGAGSCVGYGQCGPGQRCYACGSLGLCAEGCSATKPCPGGQACVLIDQQCLTCPCPDSRCVTPSCLDEDGDGYLVQPCRGLPGGDCAPFDPTVSPGAPERCGNGRDDDCDGLVDRGDPDCSRLCGPAPSCGSALDCSLGSTTCTGACCGPCPVLTPPLCQPGACLSPSAPDPQTGCGTAPVCVPCVTCPAELSPVCASLQLGDARTFSSQCQALGSGATIIHEGPCVRGEGLSCSRGGPGCATGTYCRDACPECDADVLRCTKLGACVNDFDCPAGMAAPAPCSGGATGRLRCVNHACVRQCAP